MYVDNEVGEALKEWNEGSEYDEKPNFTDGKIGPANFEKWYTEVEVEKALESWNLS